jgi:hypothetical protein
LATDCTIIINFDIMDICLNVCSVLADIIGGNQDPNAELIARWTQANTFMPTMQFSNLPWEKTSDDVFFYLNIITFSNRIKLILV